VTDGYILFCVTAGALALDRTRPPLDTMYIYIICIVGSNKQVTAPRCGSAMSCARQNETVAGCINDMCGWTFNEDWTLQRAGLVNSRAEGYITHQTRHTIYLN